MKELGPQQQSDAEPISEERQQGIMHEVAMDEWRAQIDGIPGLSLEQRQTLADRSLSLSEAEALLQQYLDEIA